MNDSAVTKPKSRLPSRQTLHANSVGANVNSNYVFRMTRRRRYRAETHTGPIHCSAFDFPLGKHGGETEGVGGSSERFRDRGRSRPEMDTGLGCPR